MTLREMGERTGKHPADAMLDLAVADDLRTEFYAPGPNQNREFLKEVTDNPYRFRACRTAARIPSFSRAASTRRIFSFSRATIRC